MARQLRKTYITPLYEAPITVLYSGMDTREALVAAALQVLEENGDSNFSIRPVLAIANVSAPTLYHHFGNADGLLSAALTEAFSQFINQKRLTRGSQHPVLGLADGWDQYVRFAAERPRLYSVMLSRVLQGAQIAAAKESFLMLLDQLKAIEVLGYLKVPIDEAADRMWASASAASLLFVTSTLRGAPPPEDHVIEDLRNSAISSILSFDFKRDDL